MLIGFWFCLGWLLWGLFWVVGFVFVYVLLIGCGVFFSVFYQFLRTSNNFPLWFVSFVRFTFAWEKYSVTFWMKPNGAPRAQILNTECSVFRVTLWPTVSMHELNSRCVSGRLMSEWWHDVNKNILTKSVFYFLPWFTCLPQGIMLFWCEKINAQQLKGIIELPCCF